MQLVILKRIKSKTGAVIGYLVENSITRAKSEIAAMVLVDYVRTGACSVVNARLLSNRQFKANEGCSIPTVVKDGVSNKSLPTVRGSVSVSKNKGNASGNTKSPDIYGYRFINICKKIRKLAIEGKLLYEDAMNPHVSNSGNNVHLIKLIKECGVKVEDFIRGYFSVLQPYSLELFFASKVEGTDNIWLCDVGYNVKLVMKFRPLNRGEYMVVSFHESTMLRGGRLTQGYGRKVFDNKPCAVIIDEVLASYQDSNGRESHSISYTVQRGFMRLTFRGTSCNVRNGVALVSYADIRNAYQSMLDNVVDKLGESYYDTASVQELKLSLAKTSFISIGETPVNNIMLMLDCYIEYHDNKSRLVIVELTSHILKRLSAESLSRVKLALAEKYGRSMFNNSLYNQIMSYTNS